MVAVSFLYRRLHRWVKVFGNGLFSLLYPGDLFAEGSGSVKISNLVRRCPHTAFGLAGHHDVVAHIYVEQGMVPACMQHAGEEQGLQALAILPADDDGSAFTITGTAAGFCEHGRAAS